jgi:hypothetical protein
VPPLAPLRHRLTSTLRVLVDGMSARLAIAAAAALASGFAFADPLDFKGLPFGSSMAEIRDKFPEADCRVTSIAGCVISNSTYAAEPAIAIVLALVDGTFQRASVRFKPESFERIAGALTSKYGQPAERNESAFETVGGLKAQQVAMLWTLPEGRIMIRRYAGRITEGSLSIMSNIAVAEAEARYRAQPKKAQGDI